MKVIIVMLFSLFLPAILLADNFVSVFMDRYAEDVRPLNNVNIGKTMLDKMAENTCDEELKAAFSNLSSICIASTDNEEDAEYYFKKMNELIEESFGDYEKIVSLNETGSKTSVWMKRHDDENQDLILTSFGDDGKLFIISVSGKIDFNSISKLSGSLRNGQQIP